MNSAERKTELQTQAPISSGLNPAKEVLVEIWQDVLHLPHVDAHANFFEIGGDSLKAMDVIARVSEALHIDLPLVAFFEDPTVQHLAEVLSKEQSNSAKALASIWAEVLRQPNVDPHANFFDIGGDSLKAMEVIARVSEVLKVELPLVSFFEEPTVAHLAAVVDELRPSSGQATAIVRVSDRREFPLSYSQQMYWLLEQQNPGTGIYNTPRIFRVRGPVDAKILGDSLNELRRRHEILRVQFVQKESGPVQMIEPAEPLHLTVTDLSAMEPGAREQAAMELALQTVREPFDLEKGPALRARLVRLATEDYFLCMALHHVVSDGFSGSIVLDELGAIYDAFAANERDPLPEVNLHFTDFAVWEREWMQGQRLDQELGYWRSTLRSAPASLDLPTDFIQISTPLRREHMRSVTIPLESVAQCKSFAQSNGTTLFTVLTAGLRILLYRWTGRSDFIVGTVASNRSRAGTERMIGCFVNPLPLRNPVIGGERALDLVRREKSAVMNAFAHQDCPFAEIVAATSASRTSSDNPLFNVALVLQNFPAIEYRGQNFHVEFLEFDIQVALLDLRFVAMETPGGLQLACEYKSALFREETIDQLLRAYAEVLQAIASEAAQSVSKIALPQSLVRQAEEARRRDHQPTIAITASFTCEPVGEPLQFLLSELDLKYRIAFAPYQQVFQQLLDPTSLVRTADGLAVVLVRFEDWMPDEASEDGGERSEVEKVAGDLIAALQAGEWCPVTVIVCFCPPSRGLGEKAGQLELLDSLERRVADAFADDSRVQVVCSGAILDCYPVEEYEDEYAQRLGNVPYTTDFFSALGTFLARRIWGATENRYSVIAMDCDDVLWSGQCGKEGEVVVTEQRLALQNAILLQRDAGMLLCLCSRSREEDLWSALEGNPEMRLRRDDFVASATGSETGAKRLAALALELGMDLDSFIFLTANSEDCASVEAESPEVLTLQPPANPDEIQSWLKHVWAFDPKNSKT